MRIDSLDDQQKQDMSRCLHCGKPSQANAMFCASCQERLYQLEQATKVPSGYRDIADASTASSSIVQAVSTEYEPERMPRDKNTPIPPSAAIDEIPTAPEIPRSSLSATRGMYVNMVEHAIQRLNDAARRISAAEQNDKRQPHASRLSPFRDISGDIMRHSTPLPRAMASNSQPKPAEASASNMPDLWPGMYDSGEIENNNWENYTDPLLARRFPSMSEVTRIEAEDERRARAQGIKGIRSRNSSRNTRLRVAFVSLAILAILALTIDTALVSVAFLHPHRTIVPVSGPPTLTLSVEGSKDNKVNIGQRVFFHLSHFNPSTGVYITHDVGVPIILNSGFPVVRVGSNGSAVAYAVISTNWGPGFHNIEAEDMTSHYTANATLQIINAGPSKPSHLIIKDSSIDVGPGYQGSNTIRPLTLYNDEGASGAITWSASSDSSWLLLTPNHGTFSDSQKISIGVERGMMKPKSYTGKLTFSSNVGASIVVQVTMEVTQLPPDAGAVMVVTPVVLSFTSVDGVASSSIQQLTVSNPGRKPLSWSLINNQASVAQIPQDGAFSMDSMSANAVSLDSTVTNWVNTSTTSGTIPPNGSETVNITVNSQGFLPGAYTDPLVFTAPDNTINRTQDVSVSLTVQPHCSLTLGAGGMTFNAVAGGSNVGNQSLSVTAAPTCGSAVSWTAASNQPWLTVTPTRGSAQTGTNSVITVGVTTTNMSPGVYPATITVVSGQGFTGSTQTVSVVLTIQPPPPPGSPIMTAAPLVMNFSAVQGQTTPSTQTVVISNTGQSAMQWKASVSIIASSPWLAATPSGGTINPGQTATLTILTSASVLTPNTYNGQVTIQGYDAKTGQIAAGGSPQTVSVQLQVTAACALVQPSSSALAFSAVQGSDPVAQAVTLTASGNCAWPLGWTASSDSSWLKLSATSGQFGQGSLSTTLSISPDPAGAGLAPGNYPAQVTITTADKSGVVAQGSPQVFSITLTVQPPCQLAVSPGGFTFNVAQGQAASAQSLSISETGTCTRPASWSVSSDSAWITLSATAGTDSGGGASVGVGANATNLTPSTYNGKVTVTVNDGATTPLTQVIPVSVAVTGFTVSGTVNACAITACPAPVALPGALVSISIPGGLTMTTTADANGNYSFSNVPLGTSTITASGSNATSTHFTGSTTVNVTGNTPGTNVSVYVG